MVLAPALLLPARCPATEMLVCIQQMMLNGAVRLRCSSGVEPVPAVTQSMTPLKNQKLRVPTGRLRTAM